MADLKLQASRALAGVPSDKIGIPDVGISPASGTQTSATANKLTDTGATFETSGVKAGMIVHDTTGGSIATVTAVDSETVLSLSADIFTATEDYVIYEGATEDCALYVGGAGDVEVVTSGGDTVIFSAVPAGSFLPINVKQVKSGSTSATLMVALW